MKCLEEVSRAHFFGPCGNDAVALRQTPGGPPKPVCGYHARNTQMIPLEQMVETLKEWF